ncbi:hypothetical protein ACLMAL_26450 [Nocardia sp. CWNU-33]|uniref:hypothetical protein n=1 Tax=Nocardia sp. CWNU-33 TaxID=3392117 RepID=UPI00398F280E
MSTVILKGRHDGIDPAAETWLAATDLAGDIDASLRLSRAADPARYGFVKREPLDLTSCTGPAAATVIALLKAGQVPTPDAITAAEANPPNTDTLEAKAALAAEAKRIESIIRTHQDWLGEVLSSTVAMHWVSYGVGPTWQEAWQSDRVSTWWIAAHGGVPDYRVAHQAMFSTLEKAGWIASNTTARSLCPGRRFHIHFFGDHVSQEPAHSIGYLVARYIGVYRRLHDDRSPTWAEVATSTTDAKGVPLFFNSYDARAQQEWLETQGWIRVENNQLRRGERAKAETRRRADLRKAAASGSHAA